MQHRWTKAVHELSGPHGTRSHQMLPVGWQGAQEHRTGLSWVDTLPRRKGKRIQALNQALHHIRLN
jgi:hypothetical protein